MSGAIIVVELRQHELIRTRIYALILDVTDAYNLTRFKSIGF